MPTVFANVIQDAFSPLISAFESILVFIHDNIVPGASWGVSIILLTVLVRLVLLPLTLKQFQSMRRMQVLQPKLKELQAKYKDDKQRLNQEMMKFYREEKVNPLASCFPLLLQLPLFVSLFYMLRSNLKLDICGPQMHAFFHVPLHQTIPASQLQKVGCSQVPGGAHAAKFLFIPDLTIKATGTVLIALIVLYIGSQLVSSIYMSVSADRNQRLIAIGLPFVFTIFIITFPAGLIVYWITTNVFTIGQGVFVRRRMGPLVPAPKPDDKARGAPAASRALVDDDATADAKADGKKQPAGKQKQPVAVASGSGPPPRPPRKKKKRSGRRR